MKNSRVLYVLLLVGNFCATLGTVQLDGFLKAVDEAHAELEGLYGPFVDRIHRRKRSIGELVAEIEDEAELEGGDAWYQSFRAMECQHGGGCQKKPLVWISKKDDDEHRHDEEARKFSDQWVETPNDLSHEAKYKLSKVEQDTEEKSLPDESWRARPNYKRHVDPMEAVKLKTRLRALRNGKESNPRGNSGAIPVGDMLPRQKRVNSWKRQNDVRPGRKLLSVEESANEEPSPNQPEDKLAFFKDDLLPTDAFIKLQNYIEELQHKKNASHPQPNVTTVPLNLVDKDRDVNIKLHMSVNATVLGDNKLPESFHRNSTITFQPPLEMPKEGEKPGQDRIRDRRRVVFPIIPEDQGDREEIRTSVIEATKDFPLNDIDSDRLTSQLVSAVFQVVQASPSLKVLWPGLRHNRVPSPTEVQNFDVLRTEDNEFELHRTENMLSQAMEAINAIIEQNIRSRSCVPLPSDLKAFYNLIVQSQAEREHSQERRKREDVAISDTQIRQKSKIVKKLLRDYEELPRDDQEQASSVKMSLLVAAQQLREMQQQSNRRKRQIMNFDEPTANHNFSPEYTKLARTAELLLHTSLTDPATPWGFSYI